MIRRDGRPLEDLVTVVIPARNEEAHIASCLRSVLLQTHRTIEVLVVDGESEDRTVEVAQSVAEGDPRLRCLRNPKRTSASALNVALAAAAGRWLVRVDAHATVPRDYVQTAIGHLRGGQWDGVGGRKVGVGRNPTGRAISAAMASRLGVGGSTYHYGTQATEVDHVPFGAYPVELARRLGGWDEELKFANEDFEFDLRVRRDGGRLLFDPELQIDWICRQSLVDFFRQYFRYGRGKAHMLKKHPLSMKLRHCGPPALVSAVAIWLATPLRWSRPAMVVLSGYPFIILTWSFCGEGRRLEPPIRIRLPAAFVTMHVAWGLGFWRGAVEVLACTAKTR